MSPGLIATTTPCTPLFFCQGSLQSSLWQRTTTCMLHPQLQMPPWQLANQKPLEKPQTKGSVSNHSRKMGDRWKKYIWQSSLRKSVDDQISKLISWRTATDPGSPPDHWWHAHGCTSVQIRASETTIHIWNMPRSGKHLNGPAADLWAACRSQVLSHETALCAGPFLAR